MAELLEALGAVLVVAGLAFWSLPLALIIVGCFLVIVANVPGAARSAPATPPRGGPRADASRRPVA